MKTAILYGTLTGHTQEIADLLAAQLTELSPEVGDISGREPASLLEWDVLILGVPTWNIGELQQDWDDFVGKIGATDFTGKRVAVFGCGDQAGYPDTFADAQGLLWDALKARGAKLIGLWPTEGYTFTGSKAIVDGKLVGLVADFENQSELNEERVKRWAEQLKAELAGVPAAA